MRPATAVPMLKLMGTEMVLRLRLSVLGKQVFYLGIIEAWSIVKLLERFKKHTKVVLLTHIDINPKEFFPYPNRLYQWL